MEVYKGMNQAESKDGEDEDVLELDLDKGKAEVGSKFTAIAIYFSLKSYNPKYLFSDMLNAWGIKELATVEKLGDYCFKIEFLRLEEKLRVLEGGPWRHKGDALLLVHYDGLTRPLEVRIETIPLWDRLYDLPGTMMKEAHGRQLGS
jgi:hypothetical protein